MNIRVVCVFLNGVSFSSENTKCALKPYEITCLQVWEMHLSVLHHCIQRLCQELTLSHVHLFSKLKTLHIHFLYWGMCDVALLYLRQYRALNLN